MKWYFILSGIAGAYFLLCTLVYFFQERLIFFPQKLSPNHSFQFNQPYEEITIRTYDKVNLHGLLFKSENSKGLIFYLHGNAGCNDSWGWVAEDYIEYNYDIFILDYRGYGKSEGKISSENQFYSDVQLAYDHVKTRYAENQIVVLGYSLGTGAAAYISAMNKPKSLILQAPYYSLLDMKQKTFPIVPDFLLKYRFETYKFLKDTSVPITIFHGVQDEVIYFGSSQKLNVHLKQGDAFIPLDRQGHNDMSTNVDYQKALADVLN